MSHYRPTASVSRLAILLALAALLLGACAGSRPVRSEVAPLDEAWARAKSLFQRERYYRAQQALRDITLNYSGSAIIDSAQFMLARTSFELEDYLVAADEFRRVVEQYPSSPLVGAALFWEARSFYEQAPPYPLDQEDTEQALQGFQRFLEEYPTHALADSGYYYLAQTREKLARKVYSNADLYFDLQEYASAVLYADVVLDNYYDTSLAEPAQFLKARSFYELKQWDRARDELQAYLDRYPQGGNAARVRDMLETARRNAGSEASATAP